MKPDPKECGKRVQQLRKDKGLSQEELATKFNVSSNLIAKIESGLRPLSIDMVVEYVNFFDTTIDYIILGITEEDEIDKAIRKIDEAIEMLLEKKAELLKQKNKK